MEKINNKTKLHRQPHDSPTFVALFQKFGQWLPAGMPVYSFLRLLTISQQPRNVSFSIYTDEQTYIDHIKFAWLIFPVGESVECYFAGDPKSLDEQYFVEFFVKSFKQIDEFHERPGQQTLLKHVPYRFRHAIHRLIQSEPELDGELRLLSTETTMYYLNPRVLERRSCAEFDSAQEELYYLDHLRRKDLQAVVETYPHYNPSSTLNLQELISLKIESMPTMCIRCVEDDSLAAFYVMHFTGTLHHLYVMPQHRRKGLATLLEERFVRHLMDADVAPVHKFILETNEPAMAMTQRMNERGRLWQMAPETLLYLKYTSHRQTQ